MTPSGAEEQGIRKYHCRLYKGIVPLLNLLERFRNRPSCLILFCHARDFDGRSVTLRLTDVTIDDLELTIYLDFFN